MSKKERQVGFSTTLPRSLVEVLKQQAKKRRLQQKQLTQSALETFLFPQEPIVQEPTILRTLRRIEARQHAFERNMEILAETLSVYIRVWLTNTYEVPMAHKEGAVLQGTRRYGQFVEMVSRQLKEGSSWFGELPPETLFPDDNKSKVNEEEQQVNNA